ncbi:hypothetical protein [Paraburkholderia atlantica]|uniref:hypothetical protein n=1 Tax=Paraburkholderia atlantica TaxID=2654982 RepID=UPI00187DD10B|nr:hypothetical protein [Paraburkholderia atlantica]
MKTFDHIKSILSFMIMRPFTARGGMASANCPMSDQIRVGPGGVAFAAADDESGWASKKALEDERISRF